MKQPIELITLLVQCIENMKIIDQQSIETKNLWVEVINSSVAKANEYVASAKAFEALNDMGRVETPAVKTFE
jgi:hypothetical protein